MEYVFTFFKPINNPGIHRESSNYSNKRFYGWTEDSGEMGTFKNSLATSLSLLILLKDIHIGNGILIIFLRTHLSLRNLSKDIWIGNGASKDSLVMSPLIQILSKDILIGIGEWNIFPETRLSLQNLSKDIWIGNGM